MTCLIIGLLIFLAVHSIAIVNTRWRGIQIKRIGLWPWKGLYSLFSLLGFALIIIGYDQARQAPHWVYQSPTELRHLSLLLLLPVFPLVLAGYLPGRINRCLKHPMLAATLLWAASHLLTNGGVHDLLLFGGFFVWAAVDLYSLRQRAQRPMIMSPASKWNDAIAVVTGVGLYLLFLAGLHPWLIGATPI